MHRNNILTSLLFWLALLAPALGLSQSTPPEALHRPWDELLKRHVQPDGSVNYQGLADDEEQLLGYLQNLRRTSSETWPRAEQAAFWLNAYNAYTVYLAVQYYPVQRMSDIKIKTVGGSRPVWEAPEVNVGGKQYSLNQIEREILPRLLPADPRRFLALHCAAASSPTLLPEAYSGAGLDTQLALQTRRFVNDPLRNQLTPDAPQLSSIFDWHAAEFGEKAQLIEFLNRYAERPLSPTAPITYVPYDWTLNDSRGPGVMAEQRR